MVIESIHGAFRCMSLKIKKSTSVLLVTLCTFLMPFFSVQAQDELSVLNYWNYYNEQPHVLYSHLCSRAFVQLEKRKQGIVQLKTKQDWQKRQTLVKKKLQEAIGTFPEKTPLNAVVTGTIERDGITVEKIYFEPLPNYYVTAALFLPTGKRENLPAIVYCSGHSENGFRSKAYQQIILNYVKKGFAVLAFDPIGQGERIQYPKSDKPQYFYQRFRPTHEHSYGGTPSFVSGISPALYFVWDGIRAVDYLLSRKEIDSSRIGIAGRSGGGTQSVYIAAMDNRILAAAPECYVTSFDKLLRSMGPQDAEQNLFHFFDKGLDMADFLEVRAPKPTLMVTTTSDIFSIEGAREVFSEVKNTYQAFGTSQQLSMVEDDAGHASTKKNREASYAFFQKYLRNSGSNEDEEVTFFSDEELFVTSTGNVYTSLKGENLFSLNQKYTTNKLKKREKVQPEKVASLMGYVQPKVNNKAIFSGRLIKNGYVIEKYLVAGPDNYQLPVLWFKPQKTAPKILLYIYTKGKAAAIQSDSLVNQLMEAGYQVVIPDLSGAGELANAYLKGGDAFIDSTSLNLWYTGILTNKSLVAVRAEEIQLITEFVKKNSGVSSITAVGSGTFSTDLLHAAVVTKAFGQLALLRGLSSYQSIIEQEHYRTKYIPSVVAGALPFYDLPYLVTMLAPKRLLLCGMTDAVSQTLTDKEIQLVYKEALEATEKAQSMKISSVFQSVEVNRVLLDWLR